MPLTGIYGDTGSGKTTILVYLLKKDFDSVEKYGNFYTTLPNWKQLDIIDLTELPETDKKRIVVFDEGYTDFDNRMSMNEENTFNTYLLFQQRKSNMSIIGLSQLNILDCRWRGLEKIKILCRDRPVYDNKGEDYKGDFHYIFIKGNKAINFTLKYSVAKILFPFFKTKQKIIPKHYEEMKNKIRMRNPEERNKITDNIVKEIVEKFDIPEQKKDITHDWVGNALMDLKKDLSVERFVYIRLRNRR